MPPNPRGRVEIGPYCLFFGFWFVGWVLVFFQSDMEDQEPPDTVTGQGER